MKPQDTDMMKLEQITHQRGVCAEILAAALDGRIELADLDAQIVRRAHVSMVPVSPGVLSVLERLGFAAFNARKVVIKNDR